MTSTMTSGMSKENHGKTRFSWYLVALLILVLFGLYLRTDGIFREPSYRNNDPNQPFWAHPDEYLQTEYASRIGNYDFAWGDTSYIKPGVAVKYPFAIGFLLLNILTPITITQVLVLKASQLFSAIMGSLTILVVYSLGKEMYGKKAGIIAAAFFAVMMYHIKLSHYATPYGFFIFMWALTILYLYRFCVSETSEISSKKQDKSDGATLKEDTLKEYTPRAIVQNIRQGKLRIHKRLFLLGFVWLLAIASSYTSLFLLAPIVLGLVLKYGMVADLVNYKIMRSKVRAVITAFFNIALGIFAGTIVVYPHLYLDTKHVIENFLWIFKEGSQGLYGLTATKGLGFFGMQLQSYKQIWWGIGAILFIAAAFAMIFFLYQGVKEKKWQDIIIAFIILLYCFYMGTKPLNLVRYHSVLYPFIAVMAGAFFAALLNTWKSKIWHVAVTVLILFVFLSSMVYSLMYLSIVKEPDIRHVAGEWMDKNIPAGSSIFIGPGGTQPWMLPVTDYGKYHQTQTPEYIILVESVYLPIQRYLYEDVYQDSDWGRTLPPKEVFAFYDQVFQDKLPYQLAASFSNNPHFWTFSMNDSNAPYELWALDASEIRVYQLEPTNTLPPEGKETENEE